jgi:hypothetical protein
MSGRTFLTDSIAVLWIVSFLLVFPVTVTALVKVHFKLDPVGLSVITCYNLVFILEFTISILAIATQEGVPRGLDIAAQVIKNMDSPSSCTGYEYGSSLRPQRPSQRKDER